ncbi:MAG: metallophosphoesterase family protein [Acidobacteriota bacterium]
MRIGVISDTHGRLDEETIALLGGVDHIVHAGDIGNETILDRLRGIAPLTAVAGNIDGFRCGDAGTEARVELDGLKLYVTHILDRPSQPLEEVRTALRTAPADIVVFGHSHLPHNETIDGVLFFNPASAGPRRFDYPRSIGMIEVTGPGRMRAWHLPLDERSDEAIGRYMNQLSR